jgi:hypothetical protein
MTWLPWNSCRSEDKEGGVMRLNWDLAQKIVPEKPGTRVMISWLVHNAALQDSQKLVTTSFLGCSTTVHLDPQLQKQEYTSKADARAWAITPHLIFWRKSSM